MVAITLPDGSVRSYDKPVTGGEVAAEIGPGLAKAAMVVRVDGELWDLDRPIDHDVELAIVTDKDEAAALEGAASRLRARVGDGRPRAVPRHARSPSARPRMMAFITTFTVKNPSRPKISRPSKSAWATSWIATCRSSGKSGAATRSPTYFKEKGETFKAEWVWELPEGDEITMYRQGDWVDLCRGPHLRDDRAAWVKSFKLMKLAGAYWRGDSRNPQLQRIYGTAGGTKRTQSAI